MSTNRYTQEEVYMAIGTEIEYSIPAQQWINYTKPEFKSRGILKEIITPNFKAADMYLYASITVWDTIRAGIVSAPYKGIIDIPFINAIRNKRLWKLMQ